jgi:hypothetical protein
VVGGLVARVQGDAGADRDLVADRGRDEHVPRGRVDALRGREHGRDDDRARMALGQAVAVVHVEDVGEDAVGPRGAEHAEAAAVVQRGRLVARVGQGGVVGGDAGRGRGPPGDADRAQVGVQQPQVAADRGRKVLRA